MKRSVVINSRGIQKGTLIFLHGLGDSGHGWAEELKRMALPGIKYILPNAPSMPVTLNQGFVMAAWYDLYGLTPNNKEDEKGIKNSSSLINKIIEEEISLGTPSTKILIGGFSQGGAISLFSGLTCKYKLGGIISLSSYLPLSLQFPSNLSETNKNIPIFQAHGERDNVVDYLWGVETFKKLKEMKINVFFHKYPSMGHFSEEKEMQDVKSFIEKYLLDK